LQLKKPLLSINHFKLLFMKKVFLLGAAALFSLALVVSSCSEDEDQTCIQCTEDGADLEYCYEEGNAIEALAKSLEFLAEHPYAVCEE
jgi:hypothetical protein